MASVASTYFLGMVLGVPLVIFLIAVLVGYLYRDSDAEVNAKVLDWKPTRSPEREAELALGDVDQMRASLSELRRRRGARERASEQAAEHPREP